MFNSALTTDEKNAVKYISVASYLKQLEFENFYYTTIDELKKVGLKIFFLKDNRDLTPANVKGKMASIKEDGLITPLHLIPAEKAIEEGLEVIDDKGSLITKEEAELGFIIVDGNNRYKAIMNLRDKPEEAGKGMNPIKCMVDIEMGNILKKVIEMNNTSIKWKLKDYIKTANNQHKGNETLEFIKELQDKKFSDSTISLILCSDTKLNKIIPLLVTDISKLPKSCNLERAKKFIDTARSVGYPDKYISKRYLIEAFIDLIKAEHTSDAILSGMSKMTETEVKFSMDNNNFEVIEKYLNN